MTAIPAVPEFQDADQYLHPLLCHGADIIRPKPRRLGDMNRSTGNSSGQLASNKERNSSNGSPHHPTSTTQNREGPLGGNCGPSTKASSSRSPVVKDLGGGSAPSLQIKSSSREAMLAIGSPNKAGSVSYSSVKDIGHGHAHSPGPVPINATRKNGSGSPERVVSTSSNNSSPARDTNVNANANANAKHSKTPSPVALALPTTSNCNRDVPLSTPGSQSQCKSITSVSGTCNNQHKQLQLPRETLSHAKSTPGLFPTTTKHQSSNVRGSPIRSPSVCTTTSSMEERGDFLPVGCALWDRHVIDEEEDEGVLPDGGLSPYRDSASNTDCGSLSKSSSDGDPVICRKRMNGRLKSRRRNILSFPHILSAEEVGNNVRGVKRPDTCYGGSSSDENRSSGHASMSETHSSCVSLSPVDQSSSSNSSYRHQSSSLMGANTRILNCHEYELYHDLNFTSCRVDSTVVHAVKESHSHHQVIDDRNKPSAGRGTPLKSVPEDDKLVSVTSNTHTSVPKSARRSTSSSRKSVCSSNANPSTNHGNHHRQHASSKDEVLVSFEGAGGVEDLRQAIEQLSTSRRNNHSFRSTSYSTSTYSSASGASDIVTEAGVARRLMRHSSMDTINTNVTSADEFVWIDSHNRLVELQQAPWSNRDILRVLQGGRLKENLGRVSMETVPRLTYLLQRPLVRLAREAQRFSKTLGMCSKQEVSGAIRVVFSPSLADSSIKACHRAAAIYTVISGDVPRQSKSARAGLHLSVGRFHRWMCDVRVGNFVQEYAAVYMTAAIENLLEEIVLQSLPPDGKTVVSASLLEAAIASNSDLWGLLQPFSHLNAGRTATGALSLPSWPGHSDGQSSSVASSTSPCGGISSRSSSSSQLQQVESQSSAAESTRTGIPKSIEQNLLTTCVGGINELGDILARVAQYYNRVLNAATSGRQSISWGPGSLHALYYFMRCSQLEHADHVVHRIPPVQELVYERPYLVLPPLIEWVRVATAHAEHRRCHVIDKDDVIQAARLLLPGVDCPIRYLGSYDEKLFRRKPLDETECARILKTDLAFRMLSCGRTDLVSHALQLLPPTRLNTLNEHGHTALMLACIRSDEAMTHVLLDAAADVDIETPQLTSFHPSVNPETQHWTALTYATTQGHLGIIKLLLEKGANPEGGARLSEDKITETPLQLATAAGKLELCSLLLFYGADPFLSTAPKDLLSCYGGSSQRGCFSAISVAAAHGQRAILHKLLAHPHVHHSKSSREEVLSLEEILAEGSNSALPNTTAGEKRGSRIPLVPMNTSTEEGANWSGSGNGNSGNSGQTSSPGSSSSATETSQVIKLNKSQLRVLQEAMYHSAENGHLEITLDLRNIGVPWTLHCWMYTLATAHDLHLETIIDQLLQDFLQIWPEDCSNQFVDECLPLLFNIFRHSKNEGTSLLLADIFSSCYGKDPIKAISHVSIDGGARIDPKYVNNPEMSDVQFRLEGRVFYAHKIILVNASPRFRAMLTSKVSDGTTPIVQITDIRYEIFQVVMEFLYKGGCEGFEVHHNDVLELMAAASFFQLDGLLRYCESRCSQLIDADNIVSIYIHAKAYNAVQLLEYCQGFLLQNTVSLLTYDDSVRKLIFGKKLHNHDVLSGLLLTLQARIKQRSANSHKQQMQNSSSCLGLAIHSQKKI